MKELNFVLILVVCICFTATSQPNFITNTDSRVSQSLNGKWNYIIDQYETGSIGFMPLFKNYKPKDKQDRVEYSFDNSQSLWVPGSWNAQKDVLYYYEGSIWYRKMFDFTPQLKNARVFVYVGAANYKTKYSLNGKMYGEHEGGFTPFSFEITDGVKPNGNFLIMGVSNTRANDYIPAKVTDWYNYGGIIRDVKIIEVPQTFIDDYTIYLDKKSINGKSKIIKGNIVLNGKEFPKKAIVEVEELSIKKEIEIDKNGKGTFVITTNKLNLWSPENPRLYKIKLTAGDDVLTDKVGFRVIETKGTQILLNGKPTFLRGISIHDENPIRRDRANSVEDARIILTWAKELGCNFARLAHYPHQENIIRMADEMGILLWEELPLYWGIEWKNAKVLEKAKTQFSEVIRRDKNRASTIIWSIANETNPSEARNKFLTEVAHHVRSLDLHDCSVQHLKKTNGKTTPPEVPT